MADPLKTLRFDCCANCNVGSRTACKENQGKNREAVENLFSFIIEM
jgi:hypothetical protein